MAGYKLFATGDVLTAAQVNTFLMRQTTMVFADSAARATALTGVLTEGMLTYLTDTNSLEYYDGAAFQPVSNPGDITGVTAGTGISGGGASGDVTITNAMATAIDAKGDLIPGTGADTFGRLVAGANETRLIADSSETTGLKYVADTTNFAIAAKGDLLAGTAADTLAALAVGTDGHVLTADSVETTGLKWVAPASGGGMTLLASGSLGSSPLTLDSISGSYKDLRLVIRDYSITTAAGVGFRCNNDSASNVYNQSGTYQATSTVTGFAQLSTNVLLDFFYSISATNFRNVLTIDLYDYTNTTANKVGRYLHGYVESSDTNYIMEQGVFMWNAATPAAVTRLDLFTSSGNFDNGTYLLYGMS